MTLEPNEKVPDINFLFESTSTPLQNEIPKIVLSVRSRTSNQTPPTRSGAVLMNTPLSLRFHICPPDPNFHFSLPPFILSAERKLGQLLYPVSPKTKTRALSHS